MRWYLVSAALVILGTIILVSFASQAFDETHLKKLKALNACVGCDLSKAKLIGADLSGANLTGADLRGAFFWNTNLSRANLSKADLRKADFRIWSERPSGANLSGANLNGADLSGVDLSTTVLWNAKLDGAILCKTKTPWGEENSGCKIKD